MLPQLLSETLCSLTPGQDKLTFSTVFTLTPEGKIISTWFGKTLIKSVLSFFLVKDFADVMIQLYRQAGVSSCSSRHQRWKYCRIENCETGRSSSCRG